MNGEQGEEQPIRSNEVVSTLHPLIDLPLAQMGQDTDCTNSYS